MSDTSTIDDEGIEGVSLKQYAEKAYLDYSMYVILDRALQHIGDDGLWILGPRVVAGHDDGMRRLDRGSSHSGTFGRVPVSPAPEDGHQSLLRLENPP